MKNNKRFRLKIMLKSLFSAIKDILVNIFAVAVLIIIFPFAVFSKKIFIDFVKLGGRKT
jgi:hypothetical protein